MRFPLKTIKVGPCIGFISPYHGNNGFISGKSSGIWRKKKAYLRYRGVDWVSSRLSYHLNVRRIPRSIGKAARSGQICHTCDNSWCINPKHLYLGSKSTNIIDVYTRHPEQKARICHPDIIKRRTAAVNAYWAKPGSRKKQSKRMIERHRLKREDTHAG